MKKAAVLPLEVMGYLQVPVFLKVKHLAKLKALHPLVNGRLHTEESFAVGQGQNLDQIIREILKNESDQNKPQIGNCVLVLVSVAELDTLISQHCCNSVYS